MRRSEYNAARAWTAPIDKRFKSLAMALETELLDMNIRIELYEDSLYFFRLKRGDRVIIEGLNPAYANSGDYRRIVLALESK